MINENIKTNLDKYLSLYSDGLNIPAISVAILNCSGIQYENHIGYQRKSDNIKLNNKSIFKIASMTKLITTICIMKLIEENKLKINTPVKELFPEIRDVKVIKESSNGIRYETINNDLKIHHLLTHTAGYAYEIWDENINSLVEKEHLESMFSGNLEFLKAPLVHQPGEKWTYGISTDWLGIIIEKISGINLESYMNKVIFDPLGMIDTSYQVNLKQADRIVSCYKKEEGYFSEIISDYSKEKARTSIGGGGLISTLHDYSKVLTMLLNEGKVGDEIFLNKSTIDEMFKNKIDNIKMRVLQTTNDSISKNLDLYPEVSKSWGYGLMINDEETNSGRPKGSVGWAGLFNTYFWIDKANDLAGLIFMQFLPFADKKAVQLLYDIESVIYLNNTKG